LAAHLGLPVFAHFLIVSLLGIATLARSRAWLIPSEPKAHAEASPVFVLPARSLLPLGALACCASVGEGAMGDWSGLYLHDYLGTAKGYAALGYAAFSVAMVLGRFFGDRIVERVGAATMVRAGGLIAAVGLGIATAINDPPAMLFGFAAIGLGLSSIYPLVFSAAGNHPTLPSGRAVAGTATIGYTGFLAGPPVLGWIAQFTSLRAIMAAIVVLAALAAALAGAVRPAAAAHAPGERDEPAAGFETIG
jgi:fucose permease